VGYKQTSCVFKTKSPSLKNPIITENTARLIITVEYKRHWFITVGFSHFGQNVTVKCKMK